MTSRGGHPQAQKQPAEGPAVDLFYSKALSSANQHETLLPLDTQLFESLKGIVHGELEDETDEKGDEKGGRAAFERKSTTPS